MKEGKMKSLQKIFGLAVVLVLILTACATQPNAAPTAGASQPQAQPTQTQTTSAGEKTKLLIWYWGEQEAPGMKSFMDKAVQVYMQENPNITVDAVLQESDSLYPAFRAAAAAKAGPDIQYLWGGTQALPDAWMGNLAPISDYWTQDELNHIPAGQRAETYWDGKQWGVPFYQIGTFWAYNKKLFAKAGLDPENPPVKWDDWMAACDKLNAAGITPIGTGFKDGWLGGWMVSYLGQQNLNSIDDLLAAIRGEKSLTEPMYAEWWSRWKDMIDHKCFNDDIMSLDLYQGQDLFGQQKVAMTNHVEPYIAILERKLGADTVGVMRTPAYGTGKLANSVGIPAQVLAITSFSQHKKEAANFLSFLHRDDIMKMMYDMAGAITPDDRFKQEWLNVNSDRMIMQWRSEYPLFWYQYYYPPVWETEGSIALGQLLATGDITPKEAASRWQALAVKNRQDNPSELDAYKKWILPPEMFK